MSEDVKEFFNNWFAKIKLSDFLKESLEEQEMNRIFYPLKFKNLRIVSIEKGPDWIPAKLSDTVQIEYKYEISSTNHAPQ